MQITIQKLEKRDVTTKFGEKQKYVITTTDGKMIDSWISGWNKHWVEGDTVEFEKDQVTSREYNGKTYHTLNAPKDAQRAASAPAKADPEILTKLDSMDKKLDLLVRRGVTEDMENPAVGTGNDEIKIEDVPF